MRRLRVLALLVPAMLSGCRNDAAVDQQPELLPELAAQIAEIETVCGLQTGSLTGYAAVSPDISQIACVSKETKERDLKIGFISNPVNPNAPTH